MRALRGIGLLIPLFLGPGFAQGSPASLDRFSVTQSLRAPMVNLPFCPVYSSSFAGSSVKRPSCTQREHSLSIALPPGTSQIEANASGLYPALTVAAGAGTSSTIPVDKNVSA